MAAWCSLRAARGGTETKAYRINIVRPRLTCVFAPGGKVYGTDMKVNRTGLRQLVRITLEIEPEDRTWVGEFQCDDGSLDKELNEWIRSELKSGNQWAWCSVHLVVDYCEMKGEDWLGGCSYKSKEDFVGGDYYQSMITEAVEELAKEIEKLVNRHGLWEHDGVTCLWCAAGDVGSTIVP